MAVKEILTLTEGKMKKTLDLLVREFGEVRTGRANPELIENMHVEYYGTPVPIKQIASVSAPDPRLIVLQPWDANAIPDIERAIAASKLGVNPVNDGKLIRLPFPPLSQERRAEMVKVVKDMAEKTRISLRTIRRDANDKVKSMEDSKAIPEDDAFKAHEEIQKLVDRFIKDVDRIYERKSQELTEI